MLRKTLMIAVLALLMITPVQAMDIGKVSIPDTMIVGSDELILNGAGIRKKAIFKVYVGALYLTSEESDPQVIIDNDDPMAIRMHFVRKVNYQQLIKAWNDGFENATGGNTDPIGKEIDLFNSFFTEKAVTGDIYDFTYTPDEGLSVIIKGQRIGTIAGFEFKKAVFGIWLGEKPADSGLKKGMLGN